MRTHLMRGVLAAAVVLAFGAPALAQSVVRGKVVDAQQKPVPDAVVLFEAEGANRKMQTKTDKNGDFLQVGLQSGSYKVTASKDGVGTQTLPATVRQGPNQPLNFTIAPGGSGGGNAAAVSPEERKKQLAVQAAAAEGVAAFNAGNNDVAITKFTEVLAIQPTCIDCHLTLGQAYTRLKKYDEAEAAYKKAIELKPDSTEAYTGLTTVYNAQKKFDLAAQASAEAAKYSGGAAGGGGSAEALFNQGVVLFNAQKFAEAKTQFEAAVKADPNMAMAQYQLGMTAVNLGDFATAVTALEAYLKVDPNGARAAEVKAALPALQGMVKK
jgi:cytochrome c-type biogenesis protein CcmH/NrfG